LATLGTQVTPKGFKANAGLELANAFSVGSKLLQTFFRDRQTLLSRPKLRLPRHNRNAAMTQAAGQMRSE